jgi:hypothetical protein
MLYAKLNNGVATLEPELWGEFEVLDTIDSLGGPDSLKILWEMLDTSPEPCAPECTKRLQRRKMSLSRAVPTPKGRNK